MNNASANPTDQTEISQPTGRPRKKRGQPFRISAAGAARTISVRLALEDYRTLLEWSRTHDMIPSEAVRLILTHVLNPVDK